MFFAAGNQIQPLAPPSEFADISFDAPQQVDLVPVLK